MTSILAPFDPASSETYYPRRRRANRVLFAAASLAGIAALLAARRFRPFRVEVRGGSMVPALVPGEWALAVFPRVLRPGDVVVVRHPGGYEMVKRVAGVPGEVDPSGRRLGPDEWFVTGDAPEASTDSRHFGTVQGDTIVGRVVLVYWPPGRWRLL